MPTRRDHAAELRENIIAAMVDLPAMASPHDRRLLIRLIQLDAPDFPDVQESTDKRTYLIDLILTCFGHPGGLRALSSAMKTMDPEGEASHRLRKSIDSAFLMALLPERALREAKELLTAVPNNETVDWRAPFIALDTARSAKAVPSLTPPSAFDILCHRPTYPLPPSLLFLDELSRRLEEPLSGKLATWLDEQALQLGIRAELAAARDKSEHPENGQIPSNVTLSSESTAVSAETSSLLGSHDASRDVEDDIANIVRGVDMPPADVAQQIREKLPAVWGNVPPKNPNFTGRDSVLEYLHDKLQSQREAAVLPKALHGMGGVGKSQIAIEYVHRHRTDYDLIWWVQADRTADILGSLTELAYQLKLDFSRQANYAVPVLLDALNTAQIPYQKWLLVFDNAEDVQEARAYFPTGGDGTILVTSRNLEWERSADEVIEIDVFTPEESRTFLLNRSPHLTATDADRLGEELGYLPLAVEQAASWHAVTGMTVYEYLEHLKAKRVELLGETASGDDKSSVAAAWNLSLDRLQQINPAALQLLQVCSFFAPTDIPRALFTAPTVKLTPELDRLLGSSIHLARAIRDIQKYALARYSIPTATFSIHRLIQAVLLSRLDADQKKVIRFAAHALLANADPKQPDYAELWPKFQMLHRHFEASEVTESAEDLVRPLTLNLVEFLYRWGAHSECRDVAARAHATWTSALGADHEQTLELATWLGFMHWTLGDYGEAARINRETYETYKRLAGSDDEGTLNAGRMVSTDLRAAGSFEEAKRFNKELLERARTQFGADDPITLEAAHDLGVSLRHTGEYAEAAKLDADTVRRRSEVLGENHPETLRTLNGLTLDRREGGEFVEAHTEQEQIYKRFLKVMGADTPIMMQAAMILAVARRKAGDHGAAKELSETTAEKFRRRYGDDYPDTMAAELNYAVDLRQVALLPEARVIGERLVERYRKILGPRHAHTLSAQTNLAIVLRLLGDADAAYRLNKEAHEGMVEVLGPDHPVTLTCATNLASDLHAIGEFQTAYELDIDTLERSRAVLGREHPSVLACSANLALDLRALSRAAEAEKIQSNTMALFRKILGDKHPATLNALQSIRADCDVDPMPL